METIPSSVSFVSQIFLVEKKGGGGTTTSDQSKGPESICLTGTFQNGGFTFTTRPTPTRGLDGEYEPKGCLPPNPHPFNHQHLLQFIWEEKHYKFQCLPFGLTSAPRIFTKLLKPVVGFLRQIGLCLNVYLHDMLIMHVNKDQLEAMAPLVCNFFEALGLMVNTKKSILNPSQLIEFLRFQINSLTMKFTLPSEKCEKIQQEAASLLKSQSISAQHLAIFVGKVVATSRAVAQAPLHYRAQQRALNSTISRNNPLEYSDRFDAQITIDNEVMTDLQWWSTSMYSMKTSKGGRWSTQEAIHHINYLELLAAFLALKTFASN